ncbi:MAG TPA: PF20097 family protein [Methanocorpusculum sp.]|nr:PF20097 family protein [Methanocorpusculum sp.]
MICPTCGKEMKKGYLFCSKDGAFSFADEVPGAFTNAKNTPGFIQITPLKPAKRTNIEAYCCESCRKLIIDY